jgi:hypothetical protein
VKKQAGKGTGNAAFMRGSLAKRGEVDMNRHDPFGPLTPQAGVKAMTRDDMDGSGNNPAHHAKSPQAFRPGGFNQAVLLITRSKIT